MRQDMFNVTMNLYRRTSQADYASANTESTKAFMKDGFQEGMQYWKTTMESGAYNNTNDEGLTEYMLAEEVLRCSAEVLHGSNSNSKSKIQVKNIKKMIQKMNTAIMDKHEVPPKPDEGGDIGILETIKKGFPNANDSPFQFSYT